MGFFGGFSLLKSFFWPKLDIVKCTGAQKSYLLLIFLFVPLGDLIIVQNYLTIQVGIVTIYKPIASSWIIIWPASVVELGPGITIIYQCILLSISQACPTQSSAME